MSVKIVMQCGADGPFEVYKYKEGHTIDRTKRDIETGDLVEDGEIIYVYVQSGIRHAKHYSGVQYGKLLHKIVVK